MIYGFGGRNCWSFKEWLTIDFTINKSVPEEYGFGDVGVVPALCFEGANASGKSCALRVISFIKSFCLNSFQEEKPDDKIFYDTFFNNNDKSEFFLDFSLADDLNRKFKYQIILDRNKVYSERLSVKSKGRATLLFSRIGNKIKTDRYFHISKDLPDFRDNVSFFSTFFQYNIAAAKPFFYFFSSIFTNVGYIGINEYKESDSMARFYHENPDLLAKVIGYLKMFDTGIVDVEIKNWSDIAGNNLYMSIFKHQTEDGVKELKIYSQSMGTKVLYNQLLPLMFVVENGGLLVYDELDTHLHSAILPNILGHFFNRSQNKKHAQIVFTAQNSSLLDKMKKYRTYLFNKEEGESYCYRIDELPQTITQRNERSLEQAYKSGLLGGVPNV